MAELSTPKPRRCDQRSPRRDRWRPDVIFVTGDIAFSGGGKVVGGAPNTEYVDAAKWLSAVAAAASVPAEKIFLVPGNHDVNRKVDDDRDTQRLVKDLRSSPTPSRALDDAMNDSGDRKKLEARQANYLKLTEAFAPECRALFWHATIPSAAVDVLVLGLNTALLSKDDSDQGHLALGLTQFRELGPKGEAAGKRLIVVLSHHPFQEGWLADQKDAAAWLRSLGGVQLSGHVHSAETETRQAGGGGEFLRIVAGAVHGDPGDPDAITGHGYSIGSVFAGAVAGEVEVRIWPRRWSDKNKEFRTDTDGVPDHQDYASHRLRLR